MDGVIVNSEPLHHLAYKKMFKEFQLDVSNSLYESLLVNQHIPFVNNCAKYSN